MSRFHVNDKTGESGLCRAQFNNCPLGGSSDVENHYENEQEAKDAGKRILANRYDAFATSKRTVVVPERPEIVQPTFEEVSELLSRTNGAYVCSGKIVGYALLGSSLYGLNTPESDRDVLIITDAKSGQGNKPYYGDFHRVYDDGADIRVSSLHSLATSFMSSDPNIVDLLSSSEVTVHDKAYEPYIRSMRFDPLSYMDQVGSHTVSDIRLAVKHIDSNNRSSGKRIKTALRNLVMHERVYADRLDYSTKFSLEQRQRFFESLDMLLKERDAGADAEQLTRMVHEAAQSI